MPVIEFCGKKKTLVGKNIENHCVILFDFERGDECSGLTMTYFLFTSVCTNTTGLFSGFDR